MGIAKDQRKITHTYTHHTHTHTLTHTQYTYKYCTMDEVLSSLEMHKASLGCSLQILPDVVRDSSETIVRNDANFIAQPECLFVSHSNHWCIHMHNNMLFLARAITQIECYQKLQQLLLELLYWAIYPTEILGSIACVYPPQPFAPISWYVLTYMWFTRDTVL